MTQKRAASTHSPVIDGVETKPEISSIVRYLREHYALASVIVYALLVMTGDLGLYIFFHFNTSPAVIWPPVGIALAAMLLFGYRMWIPIALAQLTLNFLSPTHPSLFVGLATIIAYTAQPLIGTYLLRRLEFDNAMERVRDALFFVAIALIIPGIAPLITTGAQWIVNGFSAQLWTFLTRGWAGGILSIMVLTPLILTWLAKRQIIYSSSSSSSSIEKFLAFGFLIFITYLTFWTTFAKAYSFVALYILFATLFWIALRMGPRMVALSIFLMTAFAIMGTLIVNPSDKTVALQLLSDELFVVLFAPFYSILTVVVHERNKDALSLKKYAHELESAMEKLSNEDKSKNEFIATLAHELRNPLAPVMSNLELLKLRDEGDRTSLEIIEQAEQQTHIMRRLLDDLLDVSRITQNTFVLKKETIDLQDAIQNCVNVVGSFMQSMGNTLHVDMPRSPILLTVDPVRLQQVFMNLLYNAAKYTPRGGRIVLSGQTEGGSVVVRIQDNGVGIPKDSLMDVFKSFKQLNPVPPRVGTGLGIGLSIAKKLIEMHGGTIDAHSDGPGTGSTFTIRLPLANIQPFPGAPSARQKNVQKNNAQPLKILVVDDNEAAAAGMSKLLKHYGHTVAMSHTGEDAITETSIFLPDVVLLDIGLPDIDGYEVAKRLRKNKITSTLVALTGYGQSEDKFRAKNAGFNFHLTKPVGFAEIETITRSIRPQAA